MFILKFQNRNVYDNCFSDNVINKLVSYKTISNL